MVKPSPLDYGFAGKYLRDYETFHYTFLERNLFWLDEIQSILVPPDAEEFADVSFYQAGMNWDKYAQHARAAFIRIGQNTWKDPEFETNYTEARRRNIALGGYFFFDGRATPNQQASTIINAMQGKYFELELMVDWERNYGGASEGPKNVVKLMQLVEAAGIQCKAVGIYTGYYWFTGNSNVGVNTEEYAYLKTHPLWLAWYGAAMLVKVPPPWADWTHWQYGTIAEAWGQSGKELDRNKHNGTRAQFASRYLGGVISPPTGEPMWKEAVGNITIRTGPGATYSNATLNGVAQYVLNGDILEVSEIQSGFAHILRILRKGVPVEIPAVSWCGTAYLVDTSAPAPDTSPANFNAVLAPGSTITVTNKAGEVLWSGTAK